MKIGENSTAEQYVAEAGRFWEEGDGLIDAHAHIGTEEEIRERIRDGIPSVICAGSPKEAEQLKRLFNRFEVHPVIIPAAGLHPGRGNVSLYGRMAGHGGNRSGLVMV